MKEIKTLVLCSTRFAIPALQQLRHARMLAAVAVPAMATEIAEHAEAVLKGSNIPLIRIAEKDHNEQLIRIIHANQINLGLMLTFSYKLSPAVYSIPSFGFYNFHPGPLPFYRGPDPIFQQLKNGEEYTALAVHRPDETFDTGPVVMIKKIKTTEADTYGTITSKLSLLAVDMLGILMKMFSLEIIPPSVKQEKNAGSYYPKQSAADVTINWQSMSADGIVNLARACNPWNKGAVTQINNRVMRLPLAEKISVTYEASIRPGTIISISANDMVISTIQQEAISIPFIYLEEGFLLPGSLASFGIVPGLIFQEPL